MLPLRTTALISRRAILSIAGLFAAGIAAPFACCISAAQEMMPICSNSAVATSLHAATSAHGFAIMLLAAVILMAALMTPARRSALA